MKGAIVIFLPFILYCLSIVGAIWTVVEFILFLVKDYPFNWWVMWVTVVLLVIGKSGMLVIEHLWENRHEYKKTFKEKLAEKAKESNP